MKILTWSGGRATNFWIAAIIGVFIDILHPLFLEPLNLSFIDIMTISFISAWISEEPKKTPQKER